LRTLLIANYDSYTFKLFHLLGESTTASRWSCATTSFRGKRSPPWAPTTMVTVVRGRGRGDRRCVRPEAELEEMLLKARPLLETVGGTLAAGRDLAMAHR